MLCLGSNLRASRSRTWCPTEDSSAFGGHQQAVGELQCIRQFISRGSARANSHGMMGQGKARIQSVLHDCGSFLESFLLVFLEDGSVVKTRLFAAFKHHSHQRPQLAPGVSRIVDVGLGLKRTAVLANGNQ